MITPLTGDSLQQTLTEEWNTFEPEQAISCTLSRLLNLGGLIKVIVELTPSIFKTNEMFEDDPSENIKAIETPPIDRLLERSISLEYETKKLLDSIPKSYIDASPVLLDIMHRFLYSDDEIKEYLELQSAPKKQLVVLHKKYQELVYYQGCLETMHSIYPYKSNIKV